MIREELADRIGFAPPDEMVRIVTAFVEKAGSLRDGLSLLATYTGVSGGMCNALEYRGYESTPIEFFAFLDTGGDGIAYGYVIHAPERELADYPVAVFAPGSNDGVGHVGNATLQALTNLISCSHAESNFNEVDLPWLATLGIKPEAGNARQVWLLHDGHYVRPGVTVPAGWLHVMTSDGVGVVAPREQFGGEVEKWSVDLETQDVLDKADRAARAGLWGLALLYLKEAWWMHLVSLPKLKERLVLSYRKLGKQLLADTMERAFDWVR